METSKATSPARANKGINRISVSNSPMMSAAPPSEPQDTAVSYSNGVYKGYLQLHINKTGTSIHYVKFS